MPAVTITRPPQVRFRLLVVAGLVLLLGLLTACDVRPRSVDEDAYVAKNVGLLESLGIDDTQKARHRPVDQPEPLRTVGYETTVDLPFDRDDDPLSGLAGVLVAAGWDVGCSEAGTQPDVSDVVRNLDAWKSDAQLHAQVGDAVLIVSVDHDAGASSRPDGILRWECTMPAPGDTTA